MTSGEAPQVEALAAAIQKTGSPRVTFLSTLNAGAPHIRLEHRHAEQEQAWRASGLPCAFVRPGAFMTNTFQWISTIESQGVVYNPVGGARIAPIAPRDIARVAVETLRRPELTGHAFRLTGPDLLSTPEQVAILSRVLGKSLRCVDVPVQAAVDGMIRGGMPAAFAEILREMLEHIRTDGTPARTSEVERITSKKPLSFEAWAQENRAAFL
jgi:(4-alkanoyl-5-oxo-2,5-dihydrofuran-3-yl)methyl phosphate reductase